MSSARNRTGGNAFQSDLFGAPASPPAAAARGMSGGETYALVVSSAGAWVCLMNTPAAMKTADRAAREKASANPGSGAAPIFEWGDALELPYDDASFADLESAVKALESLNLQ